MCGKKYAPVFISVYNRVEHFKKCLISLSKCIGAENTLVYISSDGADKEEDIQKVKEIRKFITNFKGFKSIVPIFSEENTKGKIMRKAYSIIYEEFDRLIRSEDDNIFAPDFLSFLNEGLDKYEFEEKIISISAFSHSVFYDIPSSLINETYFTQRYNPWGTAKWKEKSKAISSYSLQDIKDDLSDKAFQSKLNRLGIDLLPSWIHLINTGKTLPGDYLTVYHMVKNDLFTVSPYSSKSFNIGNDGSGTRTSKSKRFSNTDLKKFETSVPFKFSSFSPDKVNNSFNYKFNHTIINILKNILMRLGLLGLGYKINKLRK
jgi:hypothetical protein